MAKTSERFRSRKFLVVGLMATLGLMASLVVGTTAQAVTLCGGLPASGPVAPGVYTFPAGCVHQLTGTLELPGTSNVTIDGSGGRIQGDGTFQLINRGSSPYEGDLTIRNVTLSGGSAGFAGALQWPSRL